MTDCCCLEIVEMKFWRVQVPLIKPYKVAMGTVTHTDNVILRLTARIKRNEVSGDGGAGSREEELIQGWGEADPLDGFTSETVDSIAASLQQLADTASALLGRNALHITKLNMDMRSILGEHCPLAMGAVDMALWDIVGKYRQAPIYELLGGHCGNTTFKLLWPLSSQSAADDAAQMPALIARGFTTFMLKMGGKDDDIDMQIDRIKALHAKYGTTGEIYFCADANQGWSVVQAQRFLNGIQDCHSIAFIEQPLSSTCTDADMQQLRPPHMARAFTFSADESVQTREQIAACLQSDTFAYLSLKVSKNGGISRMRETLCAANLMNKKVLMNSMLELGITQAAALHVAATCENLLPCGHCFMSTLRTQGDVTNFRELIDDKCVVHLPGTNERAGAGAGTCAGASSSASPSSTHGLGIEVSADKLEEYSVVPAVMIAL